MGDQATFGIAITASDKTDKGAKSAEKRMGQVQKRVGTANRRTAEEAERRVGGSGKRMVKTFGDVEKAASKVFGGRSISSGITSRLAGITDAASSLGSGLGEASAAGGVLEGSLGAVGVAAAGTIGVLAAAAYGAFKLADGWAKGAASIGRTAEIIGVGTKAMQEFNLAAERVGVDRSTAAGALGGISQTLNNARYGRNNDVLALLGKMGVKMQLNDDGTVNVEAMLPTIADAIAKQNSSGRRTAAGILGFNEAALPVFTQGGKALSADMADAGANGPMISDQQVDMAKRLRHRHVTIDQETEQNWMNGLGAGAAGGLDKAESWVVRQFSGSVTNDFAPGARTIGRAADKMERSADRIEASGRSRLSGGVLSLTEKDVVDLKKTVATEWDKRSTEQGEGIIDTILNRQASGHWGGSVSDVVNARSQFSDVNGPIAWRRGGHGVDDVPMSRVTPKVSALVDAYLARRGQASSIVGDNLNYANPNFSDKRNLAWINALNGPVFGHGNSIHRHGTTPALDTYRPGDFRVAVEVSLKNAPPGTSATVAAGHGSAPPAVSHALQH